MMPHLPVTWGQQVNLCKRKPSLMFTSSENLMKRSQRTFNKVRGSGMSRPSKALNTPWDLPIYLDLGG